MKTSNHSMDYEIRRSVLSLLLLVFVCVYDTSGCDSEKEVTCWGRTTQVGYCALPKLTGKQYLYVSAVRHYLSTAACSHNINYGLYGSNIWISGGCGAVFKTCECANIKYIRCGTTSAATVQCAVPEAKKVTKVLLVQKAHRFIHCRPNIEFGRSADKIWVKSGCVGVFGVCYDKKETKVVPVPAKKP